jgi:UDP-N-acetylmuramate-alanine ligase
MWTTLAEHYPEGVCVIWRPHGYAPLRKMLFPLAEMFNKTIRMQDKLLLLPVYDAGGTTDRSINSDNLLAELSALSPSEESSAKAILVNSLDDAFNWCVANKGKFKCFTTCGARDPGLPVLAQKLADALTT